MLAKGMGTWIYWLSAVNVDLIGAEKSLMDTSENFSLKPSVAMIFMSHQIDGAGKPGMNVEIVVARAAYTSAIDEGRQ